MKIAILLFLAAALPVAADDSMGPNFTVTTTIDAGDPSSPISVHRMVQRDGIAYDLPQTQSRFVTLLHHGERRMTLLDRQTRTRCDISLDSLLQVAAASQSQVTDPAKREKLGLHAAVETPENGRLVVHYSGVRYDVRYEPASDPAIAIAYGQFIDWMCRLNMVRPQGLPPFARMKINETLTRQNRLARETTLHVQTPGEPAMTYHSVAVVAPSLDVESIRQLDEVAGMLVLYQDVDWSDFSKP